MNLQPPTTPQNNMSGSPDTYSDIEYIIKLALTEYTKLLREELKTLQLNYEATGRVVLARDSTIAGLREANQIIGVENSSLQSQLEGMVNGHAQDQKYIEKLEAQIAVKDFAARAAIHFMAYNPQHGMQTVIERLSKALSIGNELVKNSTGICSICGSPFTPHNCKHFTKQSHSTALELLVKAKEQLMEIKKTTHSDELYPWKDCSCKVCKTLTSIEQFLEGKNLPESKSTH